jgi:ParB/RepB/Spo0J family partition protein
MQTTTEMQQTDASRTEQPAQNSAPTDSPVEIPMTRIRIWELNPRNGYAGDVKSLKDSILAGGGTPLQPILLRIGKNGSYEVIAGARRFKALQQIRGDGGSLRPGEFRLVDWSDDRCLRAAMDENSVREDLAPVDEGRFLNVLADRLTSQGETVTDEILEGKTGLDRARISDRRALAEKFELLPKSWREHLSVPANRRSGDKQEITITATHFKSVRKFIKPTIDPQVRKIMDRAAEDGWSAAKFKTAIDALKTPASDEKAGADESNERDPGGPPNYRLVLNGIKAAHRWTGTNDDIAEAIAAIWTQLEALIEDEKKRAKAAKVTEATPQATTETPAA